MMPAEVPPTPADPGTVAGGAPALTTPPSRPQDVIQQQTSAQDYVVLRFAVVGLLAAVVVSLLGVLILAFAGKEGPEGVLAIGSAAVGALATMLVRPPLFPQARPTTQDRRQG